MSRTRFYGVWNGIKDRCCNPNSKDRKNYGSRGIALCERWLSFVHFYEDMWEGYREGLTIERVDVNKGYSKDNCEWITPFAQQANKRNNRNLFYKGETLHLAELCRRTGLTKSRLKSRLDAGMSPEEAVVAALGSTYGTGRHAMKTRAAGKAARCPMSTTSSTVDPGTDL